MNYLFIACRKWFNLFKLRWKNELRERRAENIAKASAASSSVFTLIHFFKS